MMISKTKCDEGYKQFVREPKKNTILFTNDGKKEW